MVQEEAMECKEMTRLEDVLVAAALAAVVEAGADTAQGLVEVLDQDKC
jgi:hypothetical protein